MESQKGFFFFFAFAVCLNGCGHSQQVPTATPLVGALATVHAVPRSTAPAAAYRFSDRLVPETGSGFRTLYTFGSGSDAAGVQAKMANVNGLLYGTSHDGGATGNGTVFTFNPQTNIEQVIYSFMGGSDGSGPEAALQLLGGSLYGTTASLPEPGFPNGEGNGTVFTISSSGAERVLHDFAGSPDGANPEGFVIEVNGLLYGTTFVGGTGSCGYSTSTGCGTIFTIDPATGAESVLYSFLGGADGAGPRSGLANINGTLYGNTYYGGANGAGTVFSITPNGTEEVLHSFGGAGDGYNPQSALTTVNNVLYGTTNRGGLSAGGVVYGITTTGMESVLGSVCCGPEGGLVAINGTIYGTTSGDGSSSSGSVYSISLTGSEHVLHKFTGGTNGGSPEDALTNVDGILYGTTRLSGANNVGTIFKLDH